MWIITGVFNLVAMLLLQDFLKRDLQNIVSAKKYIKDQADRDLIVSSQLFAGLSSEGNDVDFLVRRIVFVTLCFLPFIFHTLVLLTDIFPVDQIITSVRLLGVGNTIVEYLCEIVAAALLLAVGRKCSVIGIAIDNEIAAIGRISFPAVSAF
jgi:hypothetical protein